MPKQMLSDIAAHVAAVLFVDLQALQNNWRTLDRIAGKAETGAAVKGNAYGIGLEEAVPALQDAGCRTFFVATPDEGRKVRMAVPSAAVYVLDGFLPGAASFYAEHDLKPVVGNRAELDMLSALEERPDFAVHIDTGMNRLGLRAADLDDADFARIRALSPGLIISHLACADSPENPATTRQAELFSGLQKHFPGAKFSLCNSAGILRQSSSMMHDLVRPGIALYGGEPIEGATPAMEPVVSLYARVLQIQTVPKGTAVGYGAAETVPGDARVATVAAGYADGFHRILGFDQSREKTDVAFDGKRAPLLGRVSMDLLTVDITSFEEGEIRVGDFAEIIGPTISVQALAQRASTIDYEILTSLGTRFHRVYLKGSRS